MLRGRRAARDGSVYDPAMALLGIDHLVIAVRDPDAASAALQRALGIAFAGGGRHGSAGTFNRLAFLGDTYLELIGVFDRGLVLSNVQFAVGRAAVAVLDAGREGLATWAVATDHCADEVARLRAAGSSIGDPVAGSRTRPDGEVVRWVTAFPALGPEEPPFLIEHELSGAEWGPAARMARAAFRHPGGGALRLDAMVVPVADPPAATRRYRDVLGLVAHGGRVAVGGQAVLLARAGQEPGEVPAVRITAPERDRPATFVSFGVRWEILPR